MPKYHSILIRQKEFSDSPLHKQIISVPSSVLVVENASPSPRQWLACQRYDLDATTQQEEQYPVGQSSNSLASFDTSWRKTFGHIHSRFSLGSNAHDLNKSLPKISLIFSKETTYFAQEQKSWYAWNYDFVHLQIIPNSILDPFRSFEFSMTLEHEVAGRHAPDVCHSHSHSSCPEGIWNPCLKRGNQTINMTILVIWDLWQTDFGTQISRLWCILKGRNQAVMIPSRSSLVPATDTCAIASNAAP